MTLLYLWGVILTFVFTLIGLRNSPEPVNELGQDIAFAAFAGALWPFALFMSLVYIVRK